MRPLGATYVEFDPENKRKLKIIVKAVESRDNEHAKVDEGVVYNKFNKMKELAYLTPEEPKRRAPNLDPGPGNNNNPIIPSGPP